VNGAERCTFRDVGEASVGMRSTAAAIAASAATAWPAIELDMPAFTQRLATLAPDDADLAKLHASDLYLAFACSRGHAGALAALETSYLRELTGPLRKMGFDSAAIDETLQIVRDELLVAPLGKTPSILGYSGRGALKGWLRSVAARTALRDRKRPERRDEYVEGLHTSPDDDLELAYMKKTYGAAFERACAKALAALSVDDRLLLKQRFGHRLGVVELGKLYGVNAGTISRRVAAVRERLVAATRERMTEELEVGTADLESILRMIESQLAISLSDLR
jgi:RNA polymerase sigma-70 factor (ECF subfamily)